MTTTASTPSAPTAVAREPRYFLISAWAIPLMVLGQFSMLAIVPVTVVAIGVIRNARLSPLRWPAALLVMTYATPLVIWALRDDPARSLSKDMHPAFIPLIVGAAAVLLISLYRRRK